MENNNDFYNDDLYNENSENAVEQNENAKEKAKSDPYIMIILMQSVVCVILLISILVLKTFFADEYKILSKFYNENVKAETSVKLVLDETNNG